MIRGDLADLAAPNEVQPRVAHVSDVDSPVFDDGRRQDASHSPPLRPGLREAVDFVVGGRDRFADPPSWRSGLLFQALPDTVESVLRRLFPSGLTPHSVPHTEAA